MRNFCLTLSRFAISAWVGAASLFVITTLKEVRSPQLDSVVKAELAVLRFPVYYAFAFSLIIAAIVVSVCWPKSVTKLRRGMSIGLALIVLIITTADYFWIYQPLAEMTSALEAARPAGYVRLHQASKWINAAQVTMSLITAIVVCWPISGKLTAEGQMTDLLMRCGNARE